MRQRQIATLATLVIAGLAARLLTFHAVAVNGDTGLYLYDAKQVLWGRRLMIDFPSRSPVFEWALAAVVAVAEEPLVGARLFMIGVSVALGVAVFALGRAVIDERVGLVASGLFLLSPYTIVWGQWVKTEQAAGLVLVVAFVVAFRGLDRERVGLALPGVVGALFGVAWLIRRVAIVHIGAFCLFVLWYRYRRQGDLAGTARAAVAVVAAAALTSAVGYLAVARGDLTLAGRVAWTHGAALFLSSGQGSLGWVGLDSAQAVTAATSGGLLAQICQKCGANTLEVFHQTLLATAPATLALIIGLRSYLREGQEWLADTAMPIILGGLSLYGLVLALQIGDWSRMPAALAFVGAVAVVWLSAPVDWQESWEPRLALPVLILVGLTAGYLYRDRIIYVTYFQDFYPYLCAVSAALVVQWWDAQAASGWRCRLSHLRGRRVVAGGAVAVLLLTTQVAAVGAYPYQPGGVPADTSWHSVDLVGEYGDDLEARTDPDERVFTAQPLYAVSADRRLAIDMSRKFYAFQGWPHARETERASERLAAALRSGDVPYAAIDREARWPLNQTVVREAFVANYCRVDAGGLYRRTNGTLYEYTGDTGDCQTYDHETPDY